jgi:exonuclease III
MGSENLLCWNIRGLNSCLLCEVVREVVRSERISFVCLQESKLNIISDYDVSQILGLGFDYYYLPAIHTRGGILVAWRQASWVVSNMSSHRFSVSL